MEKENKEKPKNPIAVNKKVAFAVLGTALLVVVVIAIVVITRKY